MDLLESLGIVDGDLVERDAYVGSILFVEGLDVMDSLAGYDGEFQAELGEFGDEGAGDLV